MRLDPIAIRIDDKRRVVTGTVVCAQAGLSVVPAAVIQRRAVEGVDTAVGRCGEAEVQARFRVGGNGMLGAADPEHDRVAAIAERSRALAEAFVALVLATSRTPMEI